VDTVLFYLVAYGAMTLGAFGVLALLGTADRPVEWGLRRHLAAHAGRRREERLEVRLIGPTP